MRGFSLAVAAAGLALASLAAPQARANLITNGNFTDGLTDWTVSGNNGFTGVSCGSFEAYSAPVGSCFAYLGAVGSLDFLSQTIADTSGMSYSLSFLFGTDNDTPNEFDVEWNGVTIYDQTDIFGTAGEFVPMSFDVTGTGSDLLTISSRDDPGYLAVTNVGLNVPEPATLSLFGAALAGLGIFRRRRKTV